MGKVVSIQGDCWQRLDWHSIDRYGDTIFNRLQIDRFLSERKTLFSNANTPEEEALLKAVQNLADKSRTRVHHYLAFIGD